MKSRRLERRVRELMRTFPAVALVGPRQVGKTTLARVLGDRLDGLYLDLELPSDRAKLADAELYLDQHQRRLVIIDEIHRAPGLFQALRALIDRRRRAGIRAGQFLLLGSASLELLQQASETLAGRIAYVELTPFSALEVAPKGGAALDRLWWRGGFPDSFLARTDRSSVDWRQAFIRTYLERDVPAFGPRIPAETLYRLWQMLAHNQGQMLNAANLAAGLGISGQTVTRYLDLLVDLLLVRRLQPWASNATKRLVRSPKVYVRDAGVAHTLAGIHDREMLQGHPLIGPSWEGFVLEQLMEAAPAARPWFYRTAAGAEIDLVLDFGARGRWAIDVTRSLASPQPTKGFHLACDDIKATRRLAVYPGTERFRVAATTELVPLVAAITTVSQFATSKQR